MSQMKPPINSNNYIPPSADDRIVEQVNSSPRSMPRDYSYLLSMYSKPAAFLSLEVSKYSDSFDFPVSFLYDEYPDKLTFQYHVSSFMNQINPPPEELWIRPLVEVLFMQEFLYRRHRKPIE